MRFAKDDGRPRGRRPRRSVGDRFWRKVRKTETCWLWTGMIHRAHGYGQLSRGAAERGLVYAHRASWEIHNGPVPARMCVLHKCDVRRCVRPDHLALGTPGDNMRSKVQKGPGRRVRGEQQWQAKLTVADVREIRAHFIAGHYTLAALAKKFGVSVPTVQQIVKGRTWKHVA